MKIDEYNNLLKIAKSLKLNLDNIDKKGYPYHMIYGNNSQINGYACHNFNKYFITSMEKYIQRYKW